jgi:hypothetical protein
MGLTKPRAAQIFNLDYKQATRVVTTTAVTLAGGAPSSVDGVSLTTGDRVLVTAQATASQNGLYYVVTVGSGANGTWARTSDGNDNGEIEAGMIVMVTEGVIYADTQWKLITDDPIVIGTTALTFTQNYSANSITGGSSNVRVFSNANVTVSSAGTANVLTISSTGTVVTGTKSVTGNITGGNLLTGGQVSATANVTGGNLTTAGQVSATANVTGGNVLTGGLVSATSTITSSANVIGGNLTTAGQVSATANITGGNLLTGGLISSTGSITGANITGGNILTAGIMSSTGNATGGNILTSGLISATGNVTASYFLGNVACASGIYASRIFNGTSEANIGASGGNANISIGGTSNVVVFATTGEYVTGLLSVTGNITGGNISATNHTGTTVSVTGTVTAASTVGGVITGTSTSVTGTQTAASTVGGVITGSTASLTANVTGGNILTGGLISATGSINSDSNVIAGTNTKASPAIFYTNSANTQYGALLMQKAGVERWLIGSDNSTGNGNVVIRFNATSNYLTVTEAGAVIVGGNVTGGNLLTSGLVSATGNITGGNLLTGGLISATGNIIGGNISATNHTGTAVSVTGTVTAASTVGGVITGSSASASGNVTGGNVNTAGIVSATGRVYGLELNSTQSAGDEGGQINLALAATNTTLSGNVVVDVFQNKIRFFEGGGTNRGAYIDLSQATAGVGTNLLAGGGGGTPGGSNTYVQFNDGGLFGGNGQFVYNKVTNTLTVGNVSANANGQGTNFLVGDDGYIGDINVADTIGIKGQQNGANGYIVFGNADSTSKLGRAGSGPLTYAGSFSVTGTVTGASVVGGVMTGSSLSVTGTVTGASVVGGVITGTSLSVSGTVIAATVNAAAIGNAGATITAATVSAATIGNSSAVLNGTTLSVTGTVTGSQFNGSGAGLTSIPGANVTGTVPNATTATYVTGLTSANVTTALGFTPYNSTNPSGYQTSSGTVATVSTAAQPNITSVGSSLTTSGALTVNSSNGVTAIINGGTNGGGNIGASGAAFNTVFAKATTAQYADLAEMYAADTDYAPGTVVEFGGNYEITVTTTTHSTQVAGIISTNPAYLMNSTQAGEHPLEVALVGRVPCSVIGTICKGDRLVSSDTPGVAQALNSNLYEPGCIIGKALEEYDSIQPGIIEVAVGRL